MNNPNDLLKMLNENNFFPKLGSLSKGFKTYD